MNFSKGYTNVWLVLALSLQQAKRLPGTGLLASEGGGGSKNWILGGLFLLLSPSSHLFILPPPLFLEFPFFFLVPSFLNFTFKNRGRLTQIERLKGDSIVCGDLGDHDLLDPSLDPPQYASLGEKNIYYSFHFEMQIVLKNLDI